MAQGPGRGGAGGHVFKILERCSRICGWVEGGERRVAGLGGLGGKRNAFLVFSSHTRFRNYENIPQGWGGSGLAEEGAWLGGWLGG